MGTVSSIYGSINKQMVEMYASAKKEKGDGTGFLRGSKPLVTGVRQQQDTTVKYIRRKKK